MSSFRKLPSFFSRRHTPTPSRRPGLHTECANGPVPSSDLPPAYDALFSDSPEPQPSLGLGQQDKKAPINGKGERRDEKTRVVQHWPSVSGSCSSSSQDVASSSAAGCAIQAYTLDELILAATRREEERLDATQWRSEPGSLSSKDVDLRSAAAAGNEKLVERLLEKGANINARGQYGESTLEYAIKKGIRTHSSSLSMVKLLLDRGADVRPSSSDSSPLHEACISGNLALIQLLLDRGANLMAQDGRGNTPLHFAASIGQNEIVKFLLTKGVPPDVRTRVDRKTFPRRTTKFQGGKTALYLCSSYQDNVELLLQYGADINTRDASGRTPLFGAVEDARSKSDIDLYLSKGADIHARDDEDGTPLTLALCDGGAWKIQHLISRGAVPTNIDTRWDYFQAPLHSAVDNGDTEHIAIVLHLGANINATDTLTRLTALHIALCSSKKTVKTEVIRLLIENKADPNIRDREQMTPLHYAAERGESEVIKLLVGGGADVEAQDGDGSSPLRLAAFKGHKKAVETLLESGANARTISDDVMEALMEEVEGGKREAASVLTG